LAADAPPTGVPAAAPAAADPAGAPTDAGPGAIDAAPTEGVIDPKAAAVLDSLHAAYMNLAGISAHIVFQKQGSPKTAINVSLSYRRPGDLVVATTTSDSTSKVMLANGKVFATDSHDPKHYVKAAMPLTGDVMMSEPVQSGSFHVGLLPFLLTPVGPTEPLKQMVKTLSVGDPEEIDGVPMQVLTGPVNMGPGREGNINIAIGRDDHLLRRVTVVVTAPPEQAGTMNEDYTFVKTNPTFPPATFQFVAPAGARAIDPSQPFDARIKVGAVPLPVSGVDLAGKPISLNQYRGKVVLVDFWATWCDPCVKELPNVVAAYQKYHARGFDIVGISLDDTGMQSKLASFVKAHNMSWPQIYGGKKFDSAIPAEYGVMGIPFSVLIGRNGKIAAVDPRGALLAPAVLKALGPAAQSSQHSAAAAHHAAPAKRKRK
jgi:thiol-disulfide isomerase/thioredoxin